VRVVSPVEGRFHRWGKCEEYDAWPFDTAPQAARRGRSPAVRSIGVGETIAVPVDVHNWSDSPQSGTVGLTLPANFTADAATRPYGPLAAGEHATVEFELTTTDHSDAGGGYDLEVKIPMADLLRRSILTTWRGTSRRTTTTTRRLKARRRCATST
jgi:hypothetical protein